MEVKEAIKNRYSVRSYLDEPVPSELVQKVVESALHVPSSCNLQLPHYVVVDDIGLRNEMAPKVTKKMLWAPVNIFFFIDNRYTKSRKSGIMGLGAAMQNMALTAVDLGLATCPMAGFSGDAYLKKKLHVPDHYDSILILSLGYPNPLNQKEERYRLPVENSYSFNEFKKQIPDIKDAYDISEWTVQDIKNYRSRIAPVYRYGDRFRLGAYNDEIYATALNKLQGFVQHSSAMLDVDSYDSNFISLAIKENIAKRYCASDYIEHTLKSLTFLHPNMNMAVITDENSFEFLSGPTKFDLITWIHKISFCNDAGTLLKNIDNLLEGNGHLFITFEDHGLVKRFAYTFRDLYRKFWKGMEKNVYENNMYYKIGPHKHLSMRLVKKIAKQTNLKVCKTGSCNIGSTGLLQHRMSYILLQKR